MLMCSRPSCDWRKRIYADGVIGRGSSTHLQQGGHVPAHEVHDGGVVIGRGECAGDVIGRRTSSRAGTSPRMRCTRAAVMLAEEATSTSAHSPKSISASWPLLVTSRFPGWGSEWKYLRKCVRAVFDFPKSRLEGRAGPEA
eukprot:1238602-Pyramimonas_sp.AAC.1